MTEFPPFNNRAALVDRGVTGRDEDGNDVYGETVRVIDALFLPGGSTEQTDQQQRVIEQPSVIFRHGTVVGAVDAVVIDPVTDDVGELVLASGRVQGDRYEVDGEPTDWVSPFDGWAPGVQVRLEKVTG